MRKSFRLFVAGAAVAGSIVVSAAPAQAWTCHISDDVVPQEVGETACDAFLTVVGTACRVLPFPCVG